MGRGTQVDAKPGSPLATAGLCRAGEAVPLLAGPVGADLVAGPERTGGALSFVLHTLAPRALGSPVHTHRHEDEYSYVLAGTVGVQLGDTEVLAHPGDLVSKPRGVPHAFWNAGAEPARLLEVITPAGFEGYFRALAGLFTGEGPPELGGLAAIAADYDLEVDPASVPALAERHGLVLE